jgi:hypothetical protein
VDGDKYRFKKNKEYERSFHTKPRDDIKAKTTSTIAMALSAISSKKLISSVNFLVHY